MAKKGKKTESASPPDSSTSGKSNANAKGKSANLDEDKKQARSANRTIVASSSSWTGKLPGSLLHEHCQKSKWEKVQYDMRHNKDGYIGSVILGWKNPKDQEIITVKMVPPIDLVKPQETSLEARHMAATYALHRISSGKNIHMVLPKNHKDLWLDLESARKALAKENSAKAKDLFNDNPFSVVMEQRKVQEKRAKDLQTRKEQEAKTSKPVIHIKSDRDVKAHSNMKHPFKQVAREVTFPKKIWQEAPFIDLTSDSRELIERSIKNHLSWTQQRVEDANVDESYIETLEQLGFRRSHIDESLLYTSRFTDSLEWLIFHIPEDDLPPFFAKQDNQSKVALKVSNDIQKEYTLKRMQDSGVSRSQILDALALCNGDETSACVHLTQSLINFHSSEGYSEPLSNEIWEEELESLKVIYDDRLTSVSSEVIQISLEPQNLQPNLLALKVFKSQGYPWAVPGIQIAITNSSFHLAGYIRVSAIKRLLQHVLEMSLLGNSMIFDMVDWIEEHISQIIEHPGPLFDADLEESIARDVKDVKVPKNRKSGSRTSFHPKLEVDRATLQQQFKKRLETEEVQKCLKSRATLPAWKKKQQLIDGIKSSKVTLITGETGSGKSTQVVQFILDEMLSKGESDLSIICTQPRRISTIGLAERISDERCDKVGNETGYIIRGENKTGPSTRLSFVTTGVLLRMIQSLLTDTSKSSSGSFFSKVGYIFVDEVHERSIDSDFLLIILKKIMVKFPQLKVVLMSATIDTKIFSNYFHSPVAHIHIEGRTFPINDYYLDDVLERTNFRIENPRDGEFITPRASSNFFQQGNINYDLIGELVCSIDRELSDKGDNGSILIFLPGVMEINKCMRSISTRGTSFWILPLHSALSSSDQRRVFQAPQRGLRKVIAATNVAETSITIPDAVAVIDTGRSKNVFYDPSLNSTKLIEGWCAQAEAKQRRGRAGRIREGICFKMYTKDTEEAMLAQPIPEIKRTRLENLYLVVKAMGISNVGDFLGQGLDPPNDTQVQKSSQFLTEIGAIAQDEITNLGRFLSLIPADLMSGKLLIFGTILGCLDTCLTLAALAVTGNPFAAQAENRDQLKAVQETFSKGQGDTYAALNALQEYWTLKSENKKSRARRFLAENFLSYMKVQDIESTRVQYLNLLKDLGFVPFNYSTKSESHRMLNRNANRDNIVRAIITTAFYPQIARVQLPNPKFLQSSSGAVAKDPEAKNTKLWIRNEIYIEKLRENDEVGVKEHLPATRAFMHPSSVWFETRKTQPSELAALDEATPKAVSSTGTHLRSSFAVYSSSHYTTKLYLRDLTPTTTLAVLLLGGSLTYDMSCVRDGKPSPGIVLDSWMPIRTWCKNGVLIKQLRVMLDKVIHERLSSPSYEKQLSTVGDDVLLAVEKVLEIDDK